MVRQVVRLSCAEKDSIKLCQMSSVTAGLSCRVLGLIVASEFCLESDGQSECTVQIESSG